MYKKDCMSLSLQNEFGLRVDYREKRITINPFPQADNPFGIFAILISNEATFIVPPDSKSLLAWITPDLARLVNEEGWSVDRETTEDASPELIGEVTQEAQTLFTTALISYEMRYGAHAYSQLIKRLEEAGIQFPGEEL